MNVKSREKDEFRTTRRINTIVLEKETCNRGQPDTTTVVARAPATYECAFTRATCTIPEDFRTRRRFCLLPSATAPRPIACIKLLRRAHSLYQPLFLKLFLYLGIMIVIIINCIVKNTYPI